MRLERVRAADWVTGAIGVGLLIVLWADWYETPGLILSGWEAFSLTDLILAVAALLSVALPLVTGASRAPAVPVGVGVLATVFTVLGLLLVLAATVNEPGANAQTGRLLGAWLGLALSLLLLWANYRSMRDERSPGVGAPTSFPLMAAPPPEAGPEPTAPPTLAT